MINRITKAPWDWHWLVLLSAGGIPPDGSRLSSQVYAYDHHPHPLGLILLESELPDAHR